MNQTQKTEWITELAKCRYNVLMRDYVYVSYKSAKQEEIERCLEWKSIWKSTKPKIRLL
jgi:hypothetical protein